MIITAISIFVNTLLKNNKSIAIIIQYTYETEKTINKKFIRYCSINLAPPIYQLDKLTKE